MHLEIPHGYGLYFGSLRVDFMHVAMCAGLAGPRCDIEKQAFSLHFGSDQLQPVVVLGSLFKGLWRDSWFAHT